MQYGHNEQFKLLCSEMDSKLVGKQHPSSRYISEGVTVEMYIQSSISRLELIYGECRTVSQYVQEALFSPTKWIAHRLRWIAHLTRRAQCNLSSITFKTRLPMWTQRRMTFLVFYTTLSSFPIIKECSPRTSILFSPTQTMRRQP